LYRDSKKSFDCAGLSLFFSGKTFELFSGGFRFFEVRTVPSCGKNPFFLRVNTERKKAEENLRRIEAKLANESFTSRAPENVVNAEREKAEKARALIAKLDASAAAMKL